MVLPQQQTRPETDYERWLCDQDSACTPNANPQYHPPAVHIDQASHNDQLRLAETNREIHRTENRPHGRFLVPLNMKLSALKGSFSYTLTQPPRIDSRATSACQLSLSFVALVILIKAISIMKKRVKSRRTMLPVTEEPVEKGNDMILND